MMKFVLKPEVEDSESILPDSNLESTNYPDSDPDYNPPSSYNQTMSSETNLSQGNMEDEGFTLEPFIVNEDSDMEMPSDDSLKSKRGRVRGRGGRGGKGPIYYQRFRPAWLEHPNFRGWLKAHPNPARAMCVACNRVMSAGKSELERHAASVKHQKKLLEYKRLGFGDLEDADAAVETIENTTIDADPEASDGGAYESTSMTLEASHSQSASGGFGLSYGGRSKSSSSETHPVSCKAIVTKPAPPWRATAIVNGHVTRLELSDYKGRYLVLFFYPQDFSSVCPTELHALSDRIAEFRAIQTEVVACSVDSHLTHLAWSRLPRAEGGLGNPKIPLLADPTHSIARDYGVILPDLGHSLRAHFIIDRRGILRHSLVNDISVGRSIDEILRTAQALQHVDENETGCPADWKPGDPSI